MGKFDVFDSLFAYQVYKQKYSLDGNEEWADTCTRVATNVMKAIGCGPEHELTKEIENLIYKRWILPGGRYLRSAGRETANIKNCVGYAVGDSAEEWADLLRKVSLSLMHGLGCGVDYSQCRPEGEPLKRKGGYASGPIPLMKMVDNITAHVMSGGDRRGANLAQMSWKHRDVNKFIAAKNWGPDIIEALERDWSYPAPLKYTNISVRVGDDFLSAIAEGDPHASMVYDTIIRQMAKTGEPGITANFGLRKKEVITNACVTGNTEILTRNGYIPIRLLTGVPVEVWNGFEWSLVIPKVTGYNQLMKKVTLFSGKSLTCTDDHKWVVIRKKEDKRITTRELKVGDTLLKVNYPVVVEGDEPNIDMYTQGFYSGDGTAGTNHIVLYETKFMCADRLRGTAMAIPQVTVGGLKKIKIKINRDDFIADKEFVPFKINLKGRLDWLAGLIDSDGTEGVEGGCQISSINKDFLLKTQKMLTMCGVTSVVRASSSAKRKLLPDGRGGIKEYDCKACYRLCIGAVSIQVLKTLGFRCSRLAFAKHPKNINQRLDRIETIEPAKTEAVVYCFTEDKRHLGCFEGIVTGQCGEYRSDKDSATCNLVSINWAKVPTIEDFKHCVEMASILAVAGNQYTYYTTPEARRVVDEDNDIGLGMMGVAEWFVLRGHRYGEEPAELKEWLEVYAKNVDMIKSFCDKLNLPTPKRGRAVAPTGSISILAKNLAA
jgi:ribonucleoside-diphosphate reductase alpha chain